MRQQRIPFFDDRRRAEIAFERSQYHWQRLTELYREAEELRLLRLHRARRPSGRSRPLLAAYLRRLAAAIDPQP